jgi:hypothetical protein
MPLTKGSSLLGTLDSNRPNDGGPLQCAEDPGIDKEMIWVKKRTKGQAETSRVFINVIDNAKARCPNAPTNLDDGELYVSMLMRAEV